jgi:putative ABC transport system permease protein
MRPVRFALREIAYRRGPALFFALAIGLGSALVAALDALESGARATLAAEARALAGADVVVQGDPAALARIEAEVVKRHDGAARSRTIETISMALHGERIARVSLRAVESPWPLHGAITTGSGAGLHDVLRPGGIVVAPRLLGDLGVALGDSIRIGRIDLIVAGTIAHRSDVSVSFFDLAPAVFVTPEDLDRAELLVAGSRARHALYLNLPELEVKRAEAAVRMIAGEGVEVASWASDTPGVFRFLLNTLLFLRVVALLVLAMGGVSAAAVLSAALDDDRRAIAITRALGAPSSYPFRVWAWWTILCAAAGVAGATLSASMLAPLLTAVFGDLLPAGFTPAIDLRSILRSLAAALALGILPASYPLIARSSVPPATILSDVPPPASRRRKVAFALIAPPILLAALALLLEGWRQAALALTIGGVAVAAMWGLAAALYALLRRLLIRSNGLTARLVGRALARPGRLNHAAIVPLSLSLALVLAVALAAQGLRDHFIESAPPEAPNLFLVNVAAGQGDTIRAAVGVPLRLHPLVRGRVVSVNGVPARAMEREARTGGIARDRLTREFGFSYGEELLPTDRVIEGGSGGGLWDEGVDGPQVSVYDGFRDRFGIRRGDRVTVTVLGRELSATVTSIRSIYVSARQPFFYFYFRPGLLETAPHTWMAAARVPGPAVPAIERRIAASAPNVTAIDMSEIAALAERVVARVTRIVGALGALATGAGLVLLAASAWSTVRFRVRECVLYRALGATAPRLFAIYGLEAVANGAVAALLASGLAALGVRSLFEHGFSLAYQPPYARLLAFGAVAVASIAALMLAVTIPAFRARPMEILRHE